MIRVGLVRSIDDLGRLVIPKELRDVLEINSGTKMEFFVEDARLVISKFSPNTCCKECGDDNKELVGKVGICKFCLSLLACEKLSM